jgi:hypothetical protein
MAPAVEERVKTTASNCTLAVRQSAWNGLGSGRTLPLSRPQPPAAPNSVEREHQEEALMKAIKKIRKLRALAIAGSLSALAVPSSAMARPATDVYPPVRHENVTATQYQLPSSFRPEVQTQSQSKPIAQRSFAPSSSFKPEVSQTVAQRPFTPSSSFRPEVQTPVSSTPASAPSSVIREIRTVTDDGSQTLPIILAALALAVALCGSAYAWFRLTRMQRNLPSSRRALVS